MSIWFMRILMLADISGAERGRTEGVEEVVSSGRLRGGSGRGIVAGFLWLPNALSSYCESN